MKSLERIFLYSVLAILVFYVFLVDGNVESQVVIQEEIRARRIVIVNDAGQEVVELSTNVENNGLVVIYNKSGNRVALIGNNILQGGVISIYNKDGTTDANMISSAYGGLMSIFNIYGNRVAGIGANKNDNGEIRVFNKSGEIIGTLP